MTNFNDLPGNASSERLKLNGRPTAVSTKLKSSLRKKWVQFGVVIGALSVAALVISQTAPPAIPAVNLSVDPLFAAASGDKPVIALALSVEFPTVGAQYTLDDYSNVNEYLGYYDAEACYNYNNTPTETPATGRTKADYKRFDRVGPATALAVPDTAQPTKTSRKCSNAFSGNYLNWASNSGIDMLRLALSGGDRYVDEVGLTILQRAVLPNGDPTCFWNDGSYFPAKQLRKDGGGAGTYFGAIPNAMIAAANGSDVWAANTLNRIYFASSKRGNCFDTSTSYLAQDPPAQQVGTPTVNPYMTPNTGQSTFGGTDCAGEKGFCSFTGRKEVLYGAPRSGNIAGGWATFPASGGITCSNNMTGVFMDPAPQLGKRCFIRDYNGPWTPAQGTGGLNSDGFFYSRVQVCNTSNGVLQDVRDFPFCTRYGSNFKPTGSIQKYSEQLRIASMGYVLDQRASYNNGRYGGVLRVPMKYAGLKTFDSSGADNTPSTGNPNAEWNKDTGIFNTNPDNDTTQNPPISGVINYLNKFGRTGPVAGRYKQTDPVSELYNETLRYLQGLQPSPDSIAALTSDMYDGFPLFTSWTDPYGGTRLPTADYSCLKSNIVVVGDVNTHDSDRVLTRPADLSKNLPDFSYGSGGWNKIVKDFESNAATSYVDGQGVSRTTGNPNTANTQNVTVSTGAPASIMGQAYWAHTQDIRGKNWTDQPDKQRPGLRVKSYFFDVNENSASTNANYRRNQNQFFQGAKYGGFESDPSNSGRKPFNTFGNPFKRQDGTNDNDVWQDPANPGEASGYYLSSSARGVLTAFDSIFNRAASAARSIAGAAVPSSKVSGPSAIFQAAFDTSKWSGDVLSIPFAVSTTGAITFSPGTAWNAAAQLSSLPSPATSRNIVVGRDGAATVPKATAFTWADILDDSLKNNLSKSSPTAATDTLGQDRLNYLRGDRGKEGNPFRVRGSLLGDIVNSGIAYSGTPTAVIDGGASFASFRTATAGRTPALFVGANDGMLHAFNSNTGDELFGYIPSWMGPKLAALTVPTYINNHQAYVDATPAVASALVGANWKSVLVSGTGGGGRGVFALDVTSPSSFSSANVMWEFTQADDADMGFVIGKPQILKLRTTAYNVSPAVYKWFAVVASGVNNYIPDASNVFSATGRPALFLLDLSKPIGTSWVENSNYYKLSVPADTTLSASRAAGLINFETTTGSNGELQAVYMGDLFGKFWKLDFSLLGTANWNFNKLSFSKNGSAIPMFIAQTAAGAVQPITAAPTIIKGPSTAAGETFYVAFGTGKYIEATDKTSTAANSAYLIYDNGVATSANAAGQPLISGRARLQQLSINTVTGVITPASFIYGRAASDGDTTQRSGWYFDFGNLGERQIFSGDQFGRTLIFGSLIPAATGGAGACQAIGGGGKDYRVNIDTGGGRFVNTTTGIPGQFVLLDNPNSDVVAKASDSTGRRVTTKVKSVAGTGSAGAADGGAIREDFVSGRLSWRQINNYQERKNAP